MAKPPQPLESSRAADAAEQRLLRVSESSQFQAQLRYLAQLLAELHKSWLAVHSPEFRVATEPGGVAPSRFDGAFQNRGLVPRLRRAAGQRQRHN
jgi:hypothetical protein